MVGKEVKINFRLSRAKIDLKWFVNSVGRRKEVRALLH